MELDEDRESYLEESFCSWSEEEDKNHDSSLENEQESADEEGNY